MWVVVVVKATTLFIITLTLNISCCVLFYASGRKKVGGKNCFSLTVKKGELFSQVFFDNFLRCVTRADKD